MTFNVDPVIDAWYAHLDKGQKFKVVAIDEERGCIEVQHFDGDIEEFELDVWPGLDVTSIDEPEDWSGPYDAIDQDDIEAPEPGMHTAPSTSEYDEVHLHGVDQEPDTTADVEDESTT